MPDDYTIDDDYRGVTADEIRWASDPDPVVDRALEGPSRDRRLPAADRLPTAEDLLRDANRSLLDEVAALDDRLRDMTAERNTYREMLSHTLRVLHGMNRRVVALTAELRTARRSS